MIHDELLSYITSDNKYPAVVFKGYAGVGKTTVVGKLINRIKQQMPAKSIGVAAPTHKAVKKLKEAAIPGVSYRTVHSMLALKETHDDNTGQKVYKADAMNKGVVPISELKVLIVDEVSMLCAELWVELVPWMRAGLKIIFTGDPIQIPPVGQIDSVPFLNGEKWGMRVFELTEIQRQKADNPIIEFATEIREHYKDSKYIFTPQEKVNARGEGIRLIKEGSSQETALLQQYFDSSQFRDDADYMKVVAWTNATVDQYNAMIRRLIYKDLAILPKIVPNEKLIMDKLYSVNSRRVIPNNEELEVVGLVLSDLAVNWNNSYGDAQVSRFNTYHLTVQYTCDDERRTDMFHVIHESAHKAFEELLTTLKGYAFKAHGTNRARAWKAYYNVIDEFAWVKYNYAITGHKSQGSTYDYALVLKWDIDSNGQWERDPDEKKRRIEERNRILYTAITRARHTLYIEP